MIWIIIWKNATNLSRMRCRFKNFSNLKSVVIEVSGIEGWSDEETLDKKRSGVLRL